jgi:hypothetical protein
VDEVDVGVDADVDAGVEVEVGVDDVVLDAGAGAADAAVGPALDPGGGEACATAGASGRGALRPPKHAAPASNIAPATVSRRRCDLSIAIDIELLRISGDLQRTRRK